MGVLEKARRVRERQRECVISVESVKSPAPAWNPALADVALHAALVRIDTLLAMPRWSAVQRNVLAMSAGRGHHEKQGPLLWGIGTTWSIRSAASGVRPG